MALFKKSSMPPVPTPAQKIGVDKKAQERLQKLEDLRAIEAEKAYRRGAATVRDLIAPAAFSVEPGMVRLGSSFVRTLFVVGYARYISVGWFSAILNFSAPLDISMFFYPVSTPTVLKHLKNKVGILQAQVSSDSQKGAPRDPMREVALRDIEQLRDALTQGVEKFFQFALYVTIFAKSEKELEEHTAKIEQLFGTSSVYTRKVLYQSEQGFTSTLPLGNDELQITSNLNSSPCASSFPFMSSELSSDRGILYGINRHNNSLIIFDRFSLPNANMAVFATSGAGKSYAVKLEILRSLMFGADVIVIDPEREYQHLSDAVGGTYINISLSGDSKINPFDLPKPPKEEQWRGADVIRSAVITLKGLLKLMLGEFSHAEDSLMDRALLETYAKRDITADVDFTKLEPPVLSDLSDILDGMEGGANLSLRLKKYTEGTFAGLLNNPTNVNLTNQLVVFSIRDLEDELRPIAMYTIINFIWNVVRSQLKRRMLVIDEAWWLMQHEDSAKFVFALAKRCRKYYLGLTTITQDVGDFLHSQYGHAILDNSSMRLLLKQSTSAIDDIEKTFLLTQGERYLLLESAVGEGIFFAGDKHAAIKIVASYTEDQIITSDPQQLLEIQKAKDDFNREYDSGGQRAQEISS